MTIVDPAYRPELPTARSRVRVAVTAALTMLVLGVCFVWFLASIDDRLVDRASVEALGLSEIAEAEPKRLVRRLARTTSLVKFHVTSPRSDGSLRDQETVKVDVVAAGEAQNAPPEIDPLGDQALTVGQPFSLQLRASDPNGDRLTYEARGAEALAGATF